MADPHLDTTHQVSPAPGTPRGSGFVVVNQRIMGWDDAGNPVALSAPTLTKSQIVDMAAAAIAQSYYESGDELAAELGMPTSQFFGRSCMEVMLVKQALNAARSGDTDDIEKILDRRLGKPKQTSESHSVSETYEQYAQRIAAEENNQRLQAARPVGLSTSENPEVLEL